VKLHVACVVYMSIHSTNYRNLQNLFPLSFLGFFMIARTASLKTSSRPSLVFAEHCRNESALILDFIFLASASVTMFFGSVVSRRSDLVPGEEYNNTQNRFY